MLTSHFNSPGLAPKDDLDPDFYIAKGPVCFCDSSAESAESILEIPTEELDRVLALIDAKIEEQQSLGKTPRIYLMLHGTPDTDAVCAAELLGKILDFKKVDWSVYYEGNIIDEATSKLASLRVREKQSISQIPRDENACIILLDAPSSNIGHVRRNQEPPEKPYLVVDHHEGESYGEHRLIDSSGSLCTSTIVYALIERLRKQSYGLSKEDLVEPHKDPLALTVSEGLLLMAATKIDHGYDPYKDSPLKIFEEAYQLKRLSVEASMAACLNVDFALRGELKNSVKGPEGGLYEELHKFSLQESHPEFRGLLASARRCRKLEEVNNVRVTVNFLSAIKHPLPLGSAIVSRITELTLDPLVMTSNSKHTGCCVTIGRVEGGFNISIRVTKGDSSDHVNANNVVKLVWNDLFGNDGAGGDSHRAAGRVSDSVPILPSQAEVRSLPERVVCTPSELDMKVAQAVVNLVRPQLRR
jgi:DHH family